MLRCTLNEVGSLRPRVQGEGLPLRTLSGSAFICTWVGGGVLVGKGLLHHQEGLVKESPELELMPWMSIGMPVPGGQSPGADVGCLNHLQALQTQGLRIGEGMSFSEQAGLGGTTEKGNSYKDKV